MGWLSFAIVGRGVRRTRSSTYSMYLPHALLMPSVRGTPQKSYRSPIKSIGMRLSQQSTYRAIGAISTELISGSGPEIPV